MLEYDTIDTSEGFDINKTYCHCCCGTFLR